MAIPLIVSNVVVPLLEVVGHLCEGGVHQPEPGNVHIVVLVRRQG